MLTVGIAGALGLEVFAAEWDQRLEGDEAALGEGEGGGRENEGELFQFGFHGFVSVFPLSYRATAYTDSWVMRTGLALSLKTATLRACP